MTTPPRVLPTRSPSLPDPGNGMLRWKIRITLPNGWAIEGWIDAATEPMARIIAGNYLKDHYREWAKEFELL